MADEEDHSDIPIVDPHQHFWDLDRNYYPWLCDPTPVPFRYGDYSSLKRNYLPPDYFRDIGKYRVVKTVHEEADVGPEESSRRERAGSRPSRKSMACPRLWSVMPRPTATTSRRCSQAHAASPLSRGIRHFPRAAQKPAEAKRGLPGSMETKWRRGMRAWTRKISPLARGRRVQIAGGTSTAGSVASIATHPRHRPSGLTATILLAPRLFRRVSRRE